MEPQPANPTPSTPGSGTTGPALRAGQLVGRGRFTLIRQLGKGGMGVVWLARDQSLAEDVALKFLAAEIGNDPSALDDMRRETLKSQRLTHPNLIRIHDIFEADGEPCFISMEHQYDLAADKVAWEGILYDEGGSRNIMADARQAVSFAADGRKTIKALGGAAVPYRRNEWNELTITVQDNHLIHQLNGITVVDVTDDDARLAAKAGVLALQLHKGAPQATWVVGRTKSPESGS